jgi:NAD(P)-dependent dehydrogenase (short-subunit alcohol dehydrogenase family)
MTTLAGKTALVTGASRGIGREIALRLARDGAFLIVHYGSARDKAEAVLAEIKRDGGAGCVVGADLAGPNGVTHLFAGVDAALAEHHRDGIDILVNNAGIGLMRDIATVSEAEFDRVFAINVRAPLFIAQQAIQRMPDGGRIINISSVVAEKAFGGYHVAYGATKAALNYMTVAMAASLGARKITVNAIAPGATDTDFMGGGLTEEVASGIAASTALGAVGDAADVARAVALIASPDSRWITGERIRASGGMLL